MSLQVIDVRFEHYRDPNTVGVHETNPRISWRLQNAPPKFEQEAYEIRITDQEKQNTSTVRVESSDSYLVALPEIEPFKSRQRYAVSVRVRGTGHPDFTDWSEDASLETGHVQRGDWQAKFISAAWANKGNDKPKP